MEDANNPPSNDFQQKVDTLADTSAQKLCAAGYKIVLSPSKNFHRDSEWALLLAGGSLALLVPNLKDLLAVYPLPELRLALAFLLISGVLGLFAKAIYTQIEQSLGGYSEHSSLLISAITEYVEQFKKIKEEAAAAGKEVKDTLDYGIFLKPLKEHYPNVFRATAKVYRAAEQDPDHLWKKTVNKDKLHTAVVVVQLGLIFLGFGILLLNMKEPKQVAEPTRAAFTPPAVQEAR
jgi:hypothetical protein